MLKWTSLFDFASALETHDRMRNDIAWRNYHELTINAMRSGGVRVIGIAEGEHEAQRIEPYLTPEADIDVMLNRISVTREKIETPPMNGPLFPVAGWSYRRRIRFEHAQIDEDMALEWLRKNAGYTAVRSKRPTGPKAKRDAFRKWWEAGGEDEGLSHKQIAGKFKVTERTVSTWLKST
jgi:hypothetical protein